MKHKKECGARCTEIGCKVVHICFCRFGPEPSKLKTCDLCWQPEEEHPNSHCREFYTVPTPEQKSMSDRFDKEFPIPDWLKNSLTENHMPVASQKRIKSFIRAEIKLALTEVLEAVELKQQIEWATNPNTTKEELEWRDGVNTGLKHAVTIIQAKIQQ